MAKGTLMCLALLMVVIAIMYHIQPPVVNSFMSFGDAIDKVIVKVSASLATGFAIAILVLELYTGGKKRRR